MTSTPLPEPNTREEAASLVWSFLKRRLAERLRVSGLGYPGGVSHRMPGPNGYEEEMSWRGDIPLGGDGRVFLGGLLRCYPDRLRVKPETAPLVLDVAHDLTRQGILRPVLDGSPALYITRHGAAALQADDVGLPPGDAGRVARLRAEFSGVPDIDLIAKHYAEAIAAYEASLDYAATVMIGVCYEAGILHMARAIAHRQGQAGRESAGMNRNHRSTCEKVSAGEYVPASSVEGMVYDVLCALLQGSDPDLEWVRTCLRPTCFFVRTLRNAAGHPTGKAVARDDIAAHILLLPAFLRQVVSVSAAVSADP